MCIFYRVSRHPAAVFGPPSLSTHLPPSPPLSSIPPPSPSQTYPHRSGPCEIFLRFEAVVFYFSHLFLSPILLLSACVSSLLLGPVIIVVVGVIALIFLPRLSICSSRERYNRSPFYCAPRCSVRFFSQQTHSHFLQFIRLKRISCRRFSSTSCLVIKSSFHDPIRSNHFESFSKSILNTVVDIPRDPSYTILSTSRF